MTSFALPAAGVLALDLLQEGSPRRRNRIEVVPRAQKIHDICVLIAFMDSLVMPGDANYQLFCQAKRVLQSIFDSILAPGDSVQYNTPPELPLVDAVQRDWANYDPFGLDGYFW